MRLRSAARGSTNRLEQVLSAQRPAQASDPASPTVADPRPRTEVQDLEARVAALERWIERLKTMFVKFDERFGHFHRRVAKLEPTE